jgi:hypothetical protein
MDLREEIISETADDDDEFKVKIFFVLIIFQFFNAVLGCRPRLFHCVCSAILASVYGSFAVLNRHHYSGCAEKILT